ncbi:hypothetical protein C0J50_3396 [Silurus asotus]|uniref:Uncharacterized protein n=1 Tax=Silurus asotus TaxID=30991 RepID=A0AAD5AF37_SILAS|nr:hypothetical protein C0J50_3396 [Silurus asotus]
MVDKEQFLEKHLPEIIQKTRNPIQLADTLRAKHCITKEIYENIKSEKTKQKQIREVYSNLNTKMHFDCIYDCLMELESGLLNELDKRARLEGGDETDNNLTQLPAPSEFETDLRMFSTFPKLENWVSENSEELISKLEEKLGETNMKKLKSILTTKEPKNHLFFNAEDIDNIRRNNDLKSFLHAKNEFPKLTYSMFFKNRIAVRNTDNNKINDVKEPKKEKMDWQPQHAQSGERRHKDNLEKKEENVQADADLSELLQEKSPADDTASRGLADTQEKSKTEQNENPNTDNLILEGTQNTVQKNGDNSMGTNTSTNLRIPKPSLGTNQSGKENRHKDLIDKCKRLREWAVKNHCSEDLIEQIAIINKAEHSECPCFTAEKVWVYKRFTPQSKIIYFTKDDKISINTETKVQHHMFVCNIKEAIVLGPTKVHTIQFVEDSKDRETCKRFIFEAFAPALAVFKQIQKEELSNFLISG